MAARANDNDGPWQLMSPSGGWLWVAKNELTDFATEIGDKTFNVKVLVGLEQGNVKTGRVKQHASHFQLGRNVVWLRRTDTGEKVPIIGGDAKFFLQQFAWQRSDMAFEQSKLQALINGGIRSNGKLTLIYKMKEEAFDWERTSAPAHYQQLDWTSPLIWARVRTTLLESTSHERISSLARPFPPPPPRRTPRRTSKRPPCPFSPPPTLPFGCVEIRTRTSVGAATAFVPNLARFSSCNRCFQRRPRCPQQRCRRSASSRRAPLPQLSRYSRLSLLARTPGTGREGCDWVALAAACVGW